MPTTYREQQQQLINQLRAGSAQPDASIIPIRPDYESDPAMCLTSVVFVPPELARDITQTILAPLQAIEPDHHYYSAEAMHLTIKNIRTVHDPPLFTPTDIKKVNRLFTDLVPQQAAFSFYLEEVAPFETSLALIAYEDTGLQKLVQALDAGLNEIGAPDNKRYVSQTVFFGNVTLCRYVRPPSRKFFATVAQLAHLYHHELKVETIHLITCNSVCSPASRDILATYKLGQPAMRPLSVPTRSMSPQIDPDELR